MSFSSPSFFFFLAAVFVVFSIIPHRFRWLLLLASSYSFYAFVGVPYLLIVLAAVTLTAYGCGILIDRHPEQSRLWLWVGISLQLSVLVWLKYLPFLTENFAALLKMVSPGWKVPVASEVVAIGASYFIFQGISYLVDVYLGVLDPERHPGRFALFMSFFPKILQGPIERGENLLPQLSNLSIGTKENLRSGIHLFAVGVFKKVLIADTLASFVDPVFSNVHAYHGLSLVIAIYLFAFQLYFDFSGYTDMALGIARLFNIRLTQNFNSPYLATSVSEFWRRWHISFSSWLLDYIFKPLQFSFRNCLQWGTPLVLMLTFLVSGIWHGASWCFIIWGLLQGTYLTVGSILKARKINVWKMLHLDKSVLLKPMQVLLTFHLTCFSFIFFRAGTIKDALYIVWSCGAETANSLRLLKVGADGLTQRLYPVGNARELLFVVICMALVAAARIIVRKADPSGSQVGEAWLGRLPVTAQSCCYGIFFYIVLLGNARTQSFIYLQF